MVAGFKLLRMENSALPGRKVTNPGLCVHFTSPTAQSMHPFTSRLCSLWPPSACHLLHWLQQRSAVTSARRHRTVESNVRATHNDLHRSLPVFRLRSEDD